MAPKTSNVIYQHMATPCGGYSPPDSPLKSWYQDCKNNGFVCPTELKVYHYSKGAGRNRETPKLSYAYGNQIDSRDAAYAYGLLKVGTKALRPSFSLIPNNCGDSVFRTYMKLGFDLSSFCLSIKRKGQLTKCQSLKGGQTESLFGDQVVLLGTNHSDELTFCFGKDINVSERQSIIEPFTRSSPNRPSILQELNGLGFDLTTFRLSIKKVLID